MKLSVRTAKSKTSVEAPPVAVSNRVTLTEQSAAEAMWHYYRDHKQHLISDIRDYRAGILARLMAGSGVEDVFAPFFKPAGTTRPARRAT